MKDDIYIHIHTYIHIHYLCQLIRFFQVQDAQVAMRLYCMHKKDWERKLKEKRLKGSKAKQDDSNPSVLSKSVNNVT